MEQVVYYVRRLVAPSSQALGVFLCLFFVFLPIEENDIALMDSMILAHWACKEAKEPKKQKIRY